MINDNVTEAANRERVLIMGAATLIARGLRPVEDGPTLTHGEMGYGSGTIAAQKHGAAEIVDPRPGATGSLANIFKRFPRVGKALPAMGYSPAQLEDLAATINATPCDSIVVATPVDLARLIPFTKPYCRVRYDLEEISRPDLGDCIATFVQAQAHRLPR
ncbi:MAG: hypothetical protein Q8S00_15115 [Deltaproteobacteria bacterium]|nr:hypothetical protein [Deltaproteobacteria bacterium]